MTFLKGDGFEGAGGGGGLRVFHGVPAAALDSVDQLLIQFIRLLCRDDKARMNRPGEPKEKRQDQVENELEGLSAEQNSHGRKQDGEKVYGFGCCYQEFPFSCSRLPTSLRPGVGGGSGQRATKPVLTGRSSFRLHPNHGAVAHCVRFGVTSS